MDPCSIEVTAFWNDDGNGNDGKSSPSLYFTFCEVSNPLKIYFLNQRKFSKFEKGKSFDSQTSENLSITKDKER